MKKTLYVKVTDLCNMRCSFCYASHGAAIIDRKELDKVVENLHPTHIVLHGGEPLEAPGVCREIMDRYPWIEFSITSNLTFSANYMTQMGCIGILQHCDGVATSYSVDRFEGRDNEWRRFIANTELLNKLGIPFTLLVTLSEAQLNQPAKDLVRTIKCINPSNITFERLYIEEADEELYRKTDAYLTELFQLVPAAKNNLLKQMQFAAEIGTKVFATCCNVSTIGTDGTLSRCPNLNGKPEKPAIKDRGCLECDLFQWCQGDCPSFMQVCSFPKETFKKVLKGELDGISNE